MYYITINNIESRLFERISENKGVFLVILSFAILYTISYYEASFSFVFAHPYPTSYEPQPNQIFKYGQTAPEGINITFTERPEIKASFIHVTNSNNTRIDNNDLKFGDSDKSLTISLNKSKLTFGDYAVQC